MSFRVHAVLLSLAVCLLNAACTAKSSPNPVEARLKGQHCDLWDDTQGIPHVRAASRLSGLACLGYLHARDRMWQLEHLRRTVAGRSAEVFGSKALTSDFRMRLLGLYEKAERDFPGLPAAVQEALWAYTHGVNRGMVEGTARVESLFRQWKIAPKAWRPEDSLAILLLQSFDQTRKSFSIELGELEDLKAHGAATPRLFTPDGTPWDTSILKAGEYPRATGPSASSKVTGTQLSAPPERLRETAAFLGADTRRELEKFGSNNWVLGPSRTESRRAWLANDPHLALPNPPMWHWAHVEAGDWDVIGAALPGIPFIVSGTNRKLAWGLTNAYLDVADLTEVPSKELAGLEKFRPLIWFRFAGIKLPFFFKSFRRTASGLPVLPTEASPGHSYVLSWTTFELTSERLGRSIQSLFDLAASASVEKADAAFSGVELPTWNFVFADATGAIGYRSVGRIPVRQEAPAFGVRRLSLTALEREIASRPVYTAAEMPHVLKPKRDFIVTANNRQWPAGAAFHGGRAYSPGFRAFRIEELLAQTRAHGMQSQRRIQCDTQAVDARFLLPALLAALPAEELAKAPLPLRSAVQKLSRWRADGYEASLGCRPCALYRRWVDRLQEGEGADETALYRLASRPSPEFRLATLITLQEAFREVSDRDELPEWRAVHRNGFARLGVGETPSLASSLPTPGDEHSVNPGSSEWRPLARSQKGWFEHTDGASMRMLVEMVDPPQVYAILPGPNADRGTVGIRAEEGPWKKWADCSLEKREFPVDWRMVQLQSLDL